MKILNAKFIESSVEPDRFRGDRLPEIAVVGRSNVGKSSLINSLLRRKGLARISRTPGRTRTVNFFEVATSDPLIKRFYLVDLPGYGYAEVSKATRAEWGPMIERCLSGRPLLRGVLMLVDARGATDHDAITLGWLRDLGKPAAILATKVDKLSRGERGRKLLAIRQALALPEAMLLIPYSVVTREGGAELWQALRDILSKSSDSGFSD